MAKRVCIIGAGASGLTAIKSCLEEGLEPVCYEKTSDIGGLWRFRDEDEDGVPSVMKSTIINTSKELNAFSDFPPSPELPNFMHNTCFLKYLEDYAKKFDLIPHINLNQTVVKVDYAKDYDDTGKWTVHVKKDNGKITEETFDGVLLCNGHHVDPRYPKISGLDKFEGTAIHSHSYKTPTNYENKNVLVVGIGNSGVDVAVELSRISKKVYLSTRRGAWIFHRVSKSGLPFDVIINTRWQALMKKILSWEIINSITEMQLNGIFDHEKYGIRPNHRVYSQHPTLSDGLVNCLASGTVVLKDDIHHFTKDAVVFKGEEDIEYPIDAVVFSTGYNIAFPFLSKDIISVDENRVSLYKNVFPTHLKHPTLAVIGLVQPFGSIIPVSEIQSRWVASVIKGDTQLCGINEMLDDIKKSQKVLSSFVDSPRHTIQVEYINYMDEIGQLIGAKPNLIKIFFTDPQLFFTMYYGPCYSYQYRINGPHPWNGAVNCILNGRKRIWHSTKPKNSRKSDKNSYLNTLAQLFFGFMLVWYTLFVELFAKLA